MDSTEKFEKMTEGQNILRETKEKKWTLPLNDSNLASINQIFTRYWQLVKNSQ